jgi:3',5'-cyclic AMP phosphodiesterase CpdA
MKTRREILRLAGLTLVAHSLARGAEAAPGSFEFIVVNDTHYFDEECGAWFERVVAAMRASAPNAVFCLHAGDVSDLGTQAGGAAMAKLFGRLDIAFHPVPGNHDFYTNPDRAGYDAVFPGKTNYRVAHGGWQFLALDTTEKMEFEGTTISDTTLGWLERELPKFDPRQPLFAFTHFPLAETSALRPVNADALLALLAKTNLRWVHSGHWHGENVTAAGHYTLTISRCCARVRGNRDGSPLKGWHVYRAAPDGTLARRFVEAPAVAAPLTR